MKSKTMMIVCILGVLFLLNIRVDQAYNTDELIRFHVLANSDSESDQSLKLAVKNRIVSEMQPLLAQSKNIDESRQILHNQLSRLKTQAEAELQAHGCSETVEVQYGRFDFPIKHYGSFTLPAGNYEAVRVVIGEGQGQNWWCVLFPPMCFVDGNQVEADELEKYSKQAPKQEIVIKWRIAQWLEKHD